MTAWLPLVVWAVAQIIVRLIGVAAMIWQERERAKAHCAQMQVVSATGVLFFERRDGAALAIVPQGMTNCGPGEAAASAAEAGTEGHL
jgi:hypothetical protein